MPKIYTDKDTNYVSLVAYSHRIFINAHLTAKGMDLFLLLLILSLYKARGFEGYGGCTASHHIVP